MLANETTEKGKPSNENTNVKFGRLISDISQFSKAFHPTKSNEQLIFNALSNVKEMNKFSLGDPNKFKFFKAQLNHRIETATTDNKKELNKITSNSMLSEEKIATEINTINNIADSAAWAQKNKWMDTRRAIGWTVGMNQTELRGLSNKDKFNINWKLVTSTNSKVKLNLQTWKKNLVTLASEKTEKHRKLPSFLTKSRYRIKDYKGVDERITLAPL